MDLVTREWIFGYLELSRKIGFLRDKSGTKIFFIFSANFFLMIFHIILIIPKNENKSLVQLAIKTIYSTCHFKNLFFSGMPNPSLIINAFFINQQTAQFLRMVSSPRLYCHHCHWWNQVQKPLQAAQWRAKNRKKIVHQNKKFGEIDSYHELFAQNF